MAVEERLWNDEPYNIVRDRFVSSREYTGYIRNLLEKTWLPVFLAPVGGAASRMLLRFFFGNKDSIEDFQGVAGKGLEILIKHTMDDFEFNIEALAEPLEESKRKNKGIIFLSTHVDAILDAALTSYVLLNEANTSTPYIAFGNNFLKYSLFADFFALNKGFPVYRDLKGREVLEEVGRLSGVIDGYTSNREHVWIANQSHRAKDGNNSTQKRVVESLYAAHRSIPLGEWLDTVILVPVTISYEFLPNDVMFTLELFKKEFYKKRGEEYANPKGWDMKTFMNGLVGQKTHVALHFGQRIRGDFDSLIELVKAIDAEIHGNYALTPPNKIANDMIALRERGNAGNNRNDVFGFHHYISDDVAKFGKRYKAATEELKAGLTSEMEMVRGAERSNIEEQAKDMFVRFYANPAINSNLYKSVNKSVKYR